MDEEITIIDTNARNEKIRNFFMKNKKVFIITFSIVFISLIVFFSLEEIKKRNKIKLANQFNLSVLQFKTVDKQKTITDLTSIVNKKDITYSPLALYYLLDNNIIENNDKINILFDVLIDEMNLEKEIKNLIIYKKALFNSNTATENDLLEILNPIINSESIWKSHALYLMAEYFYSKNEKQKSKEFFNEIIILENANSDLKKEAQKRVNRDLSD